MTEAAQLAFGMIDGQFVLPDEDGYRSDFERSPCFGCENNCCHGVALWVKERDLGTVFVEPDRIGQRRDGEVQIFYKTCEHLQDDGGCGIYHDPARPQQCADFPYGPDVTDPDLPPAGCQLPIRRLQEIELIDTIGG